MSCLNCDRSTEPGQPYCDYCLNSWPVMKSIIKTRQAEQYGAVNRENQPLILREMQRLDTLWKRDRPGFKRETRTWTKKA